MMRTRIESDREHSMMANANRIGRESRGPDNREHEVHGDVESG